MKQFLLLTFFLGFSLTVIAQPYKDVYDLYKERKFDKAIKLGTAYLQKDTASALLNMYVGSSYYYKGSYREAIPYLKNGASCTNCDSYVKAWSMVDLGGCYFMVDDYTMAKTTLRACLKPNATPMEIPKAKKAAAKQLRRYSLSENFDCWTVVETEHFRFHIQDTLLLGSVKTYTAAQEETYTKINEYLNAKPFKIIDFYLWSSSDSIVSEFGSGSSFILSKDCIVHSQYNQRIGLKIAYVLSDLSIATEVKSKFISEGFAAYFDESIRNKMAFAKKGSWGAKISVEDLWKKPEKFRSQNIYQIGGAFVEFLVKNGTVDQMKQLLKGQTIKNAKEIYANFDELVAKFEKEFNS